MMITLVTYISSICALVCCGQHNNYPTNYGLLGVFTLSVSYIVAFATLHYQPLIVAEAACLTAAMVVAITIYAATTKTDFSIFGPIFHVFFFITFMGILLGVICGFVSHLAYCCFGVVLFSFYLLWDVQMIIGGKNTKYKFDEDSHVLAAIVLYLDIINIFLYILEILGRK